jgi:transposase-like protein
VNQVLWEQWRQRIEAQRSSGLSITAFCRREGVSPHGFHVWKRKLRDGTAGRHPSREAVAKRHTRRRQAAVTRRRGTRSSLASSAVLGRPGEFLQLPVTASRPSPWIELALADGTIVRVPQQNIAAVVSVLRVLRGERPDLSSAEPRHA